MLTKEEIEKLFLCCIGELKLLIEVSCEHGSLVERLSTINNTIELLYEQTVLKERNGKHQNWTEDAILYAAPAGYHMLYGTTFSMGNYSNQGYPNGHRVPVRWVVVKEIF